MHDEPGKETTSEKHPEKNDRTASPAPIVDEKTTEKNDKAAKAEKSEKPEKIEKTSDKQNEKGEKASEKQSEKNDKTEKVEKSSENQNEKTSEKPVEKSEKPTEKPHEKTTTKPAGKDPENGFLHFQSRLRNKEGELAGKTILILNSGGKKKEFILKRAAQLGASIALVNKTLTWEKKYVEHFIQADPYNHAEVIEKLKRFIKRVPVDGAVTFWEDDVPLLAKVCKKFKLAGPSLDTAEKGRNKFRMREAFQAAGIRTPKFSLLNSPEDVERAIKEVGLPAVIKPAWGSDSEFVVKVETEEEARNVYTYEVKNAVPKFNPIFTYNQSSFIYEEYVDGTEVNVESVTFEGETTIIAISDKLPMKEPFFIERGDVAPTRFERESQERIKEAVVAAIKAVGQKNGVNHTEVKMVKDGPCVIETALRMGGDYLWDWTRQVWNVDLVEQALRICIGLPPNPRRTAEPLCYLIGHYFIPENSGVVAGIRPHPGFFDTQGLDTLYLHKRVGDTILVPPEGFENLGWIVAKGDSHVDAERKLEELRQSIQFSLMGFEQGSSVGKTSSRTFSTEVQETRVTILRGRRIEKLKLLQTENLPPLHIGILCNLYQPEAGEKLTEVESDLTSVGKNIQKALEKKGHRVTFFDMNEYPLPFETIMESKVDIVFNVCERINGSSLLEPHAASFLDMLNIPYTGSNPATLALCIDKIRMKKLLDFHDVPTPNWDYVYAPDDEVDPSLKYPLIVKPANADNSIGITNESVVKNEEELRKQLRKLIMKHHCPALIEEYIEGDEYDVTIIGNGDHVQVLPFSRSTFDKLPSGVWHIYPYEAKWSEKSVYDGIEVQRAPKLPSRITSLISEIALDTYNIFDCHDYGRVEVRVDKNENPYVIELNPNPSINDGDAVPGACEFLGLDYAGFIEYVLKLAIQRYKDKPPFHHLTTSSTL